MEDIEEKTERHVTTQTLIALIPGIGGALDSLLLARADKIQRDRFERWNNALRRRGGTISEETLDSDETAHRVMITLRAVSRERDSKKIECFAQLFRTAGMDDSFDGDIYQEFVQILEDLSPRELRVLIRLNKFKEAAARIDGDESVRSQTSWSDFHDSMTKMGIPLDQHAGVLQRLARTGLYKEIANMSLGGVGSSGTLTGTWKMFHQFVINADLERMEDGQVSP
jgi:hypothetical protein